MSKNTKEHILSAVTTFLTGFLIAVLPLIQTVTVEQIETGAVIGILLAGARAGVKFLVQWATKWASGWLTSRQS